MLVYQRVFSTNFAWVKSMKSSVCWRFCNPHFASGKRLHFAVENMGDLWLVYRNMVDLSSSQSVNVYQRAIHQAKHHTRILRNSHEAVPHDLGDFAPAPLGSLPLRSGSEPLLYPPAMTFSAWGCSWGY